MARTKVDPLDTKPVVKRVSSESIRFFLNEDDKFSLNLYNYIEFDNRLVLQMKQEYLYDIARSIAVFIHDTKKEYFEIRFKSPLSDAEINELKVYTKGDITIDVYKIIINLKISPDKTKLLMSIDQTPMLQDEGVMVKGIIDDMMGEIKYHEYSIKRLKQRIDECQRWLNRKIEEKE